MITNDLLMPSTRSYLEKKLYSILLQLFTKSKLSNFTKLMECLLALVCFVFLFTLILLELQEQNEENESSAFDELGKLGEEMDFLPEAKLAFIGNQKKRPKVTNKKRSEVKRIQYATRGKNYSYCEAEVPDDDHYICKLSVIVVFFFEIIVP